MVGKYQFVVRGKVYDQSLSSLELQYQPCKRLYREDIVFAACTAKC